MEQARAVEDLIGGIYDAAADPELWSDAIARIVEATGCRTGVFYEHDMATHQSQPLGFHRFNTEFMQDYVAHYGALDPWNARVMQWPVGIAAPTYLLMPEDEFRRTEFYQDYLRKTGAFYGLGGLVERADGRIAVFGVQRGYEDGRFETESVDLVSALMPHLKRAYRMHSAVGRAQRDREIFEETLRVVPQSVLIVDRDARLVFANRAAERMLEAGDGIRLVSGRLTAAHRDDQASFASLFNPLGALEGSGAVAALRRPQNRRPLLVQAVPLRSHGRWNPAGRVVLLIDVDPPPSPSPDRLALLFGLTVAEARLWADLAAGATLAEIGRRRQVSINTLRVQLARLFNKVGVHRQADLVRRALELREAPGGGNAEAGRG
ncbi:helix-turn-helix transcriptional regulator [Dongia sedimenti]|uniref:Helix-turn-helix transcriptional regulator n=1 Tax=Dongia sedimenti TaxID=3064282 RepID=A0ABU0YMV4_9PROT|nr:helix-turn-helix transcriptional regulator [Rhodospirillaceae bacterium R-7]